MISCTEFIPAYSELFSYLEETYEEEEVRRFWKYLFNPDGKGIPLVNFLQREGIRGCLSYWTGTLSEEAADVTLYLNENAGWYKLEMHRCPSKDRLLKLQDEIGLKPYHNYCLHCDNYRQATETVGMKYMYDFSGIDHASCAIFVYEPGVFDGKLIVDGNTEVLEIRATENEYFHPDFHSSLNMGIDYLGKVHGKESLQEYFKRYTLNVYKPILAEMESDPLKAIENKIRNTYVLERAEDALTMTNDGKTLSVSIAYCPAVKHLRKTGREVSEYFRYSTESVMETLAEKAGLTFEMKSYDNENGAAEYSFSL